MHIHWLYLVAALALIWFPADRLLPARARLRTFESLRNRPQGGKRRRPWFWLAVHGLDPLRGGGSVWLLSRAFTFPPEAVVEGATVHLPLGLTSFVLAVGLLIQTRTNRESDYLLAPILLLSGVMLAWLPWEVSVFSLVLAFASIFAFHTWAVFFGMGAATTVALGLMMEAPKLPLAIAGGLMMLPVLLAWVSQRLLVVPARQ